MNDFDVTIQKIHNDSLELSNGVGLVAPLGIKDNGEIEYTDYSRINNMIICGTTGSGKTTFVRTLIASLCSISQPTNVKFCIFDSRKSDYMEFRAIPNLLIPIIHNSRRCCGMISWALSEAEKREALLRDTLVEINFPEIFIILDDYAELAKEPEAEATLCKLLQIAHRVNIHIILVTSIALARIISTELKVHIPHRIAFFLPERRNSQVVIDQNGAEALDMPGQFIAKFYSNANTYRSIELLDSETQKVYNQYKSENLYDEDVIKEIESKCITVATKTSFDYINPIDSEDAMYYKAVETVIEAGMASTTLLQRKLKLGYARAARLIDEMSEKGIIGPFEGSMPRKVLITKEQFVNGDFTPAEKDALITQTETINSNSQLVENTYFVEAQIPNAEKQQKPDRNALYRSLGLCQYCGGKFKGLFTTKCSVCGQPKNY